MISDQMDEEKAGLLAESKYMFSGLKTIREVRPESKSEDFRP